MYSLGHGRFLRKGPALFLEPGGVISQETRRFNLYGGFGKVVTHGLKVAHIFAKVLALPRVLNSVIECALSHADHMCSNADTTFIENLDGNLNQLKCRDNAHLVTLANLAHDILLGNLDIVKGEHASRGRANTELSSTQPRSGSPFFPFWQSRRPYPST